MTDKVALIAGASRGLGLGLAKELSGRGWRVFATVRDRAKATDLAAAADASHGRITVEVLDIDDAGSVEKLGQRLEGEPLDLLFVNAGVSGPEHGDAAKATPEETSALFTTNTTAPIRLARRLRDNVREGDGVIGFMTSQLGSVGNNTTGGMAMYRASKAALNTLIRTFTAALKERKLTVLAMHPGWVRTDMGGPNAALSVEESVKGIADVIEAKAGTLDHGFYDYAGKTIPW